MKRAIFTLGLIFALLSLNAQVYLEKKSRHRFAQMNFGLDVQQGFGGQSTYLNQEGQELSFDLPNFTNSRFIIGGTHFWGHADFYIAFPLFNRKLKKENQNLQFNSGVETIFKYYPKRIEESKIRPYVGTGFSMYSFQQENTNWKYGKGSAINQAKVPILLGFTLLKKNKLIELGVTYLPDNQLEYFISPEKSVQVELPAFQINLSFRFMLETTLSAEKSWESGKMELYTKYLAEEGKLNNFFLGLGFSSAFYLEKSDLLKADYPSLGAFAPAVFGDFSAGYYWHKPDFAMAFNYRGYQSTASAYGVEWESSRKSIGLEAIKFIGDYHGFVPFVGPIISKEFLQAQAKFQGIKGKNYKDEVYAYGLSFGWDIRPNRVQSWLLRTNLRWFPSLDLDLEQGESISFQALEFNFIQLIIYPSRMF